MTLKRGEAFIHRDEKAGYDVLIQDWECEVCGEKGTTEQIDHIAGPGFVGMELCPKCPKPQWMASMDIWDTGKAARKSALENARVALAKKRLVAAQEAQKGQDD